MMDKMNLIYVIMNKLVNSIILSCLVLIPAVSLEAWYDPYKPWTWLDEVYKGAKNVGEFSLARTTAENHTPIYTDAYAKTVKNVDYALGVQNGFVVPQVYNLGSTSRRKFNGNEFLGYSQPGTAIELFVDGKKQEEAYPLTDNFERTLIFGNTQVTLKINVKQLPVIPAVGMKNDDATGYQDGKVYFVTMQVAELGPMQPEKEESGEWGDFDLGLRYKYEQEVRGLKDKHLTGVNLDVLTDKEMESLARKMSAERREIGIKYKKASPEPIQNLIFSRNQDKYGDKYGPTISYLRNVEGKTWKQIIESSSKPGGNDFPTILVTKTSSFYGSYKYGKVKQKDL